MAQRVACIVIADLHIWMGRPDLDAFVGYINVHSVNGTSTEGITKPIAAMLDWGHRYKTIQRNLDKGCLLCLGVDLPETQ